MGRFTGRLPPVSDRQVTAIYGRMTGMNGHGMTVLDTRHFRSFPLPLPEQDSPLITSRANLIQLGVKGRLRVTFLTFKLPPTSYM